MRNGDRGDTDRRCMVAAVDVVVGEGVFATEALRFPFFRLPS